MNFAVGTGVVSFGLTVIFCGTVAASPVRTVSVSRQFIVYGPDLRLRGAVAELAEQTKKAALTLLQERDAWKTPIVINAQYPEANQPELPPARLNLSQTGSGLKLQLELRIGAEVDAGAVRRELLRAIYLEMIYRALPETPAGAPIAQPPEWFLEGTLALAELRDSPALAKMLSGVVASGQTLALEDFLGQRPGLLESPSRALYRAYAAAFVSMLIELPEGHRHLARYVAGLPGTGNDSLGNLRKFFPALNADQNELQKIWSLNIARLAANESYRFLSCEETERQLAQLINLELRVSNQPSAIYSLEEFARFINEPAASGALQEMTRRLLLLSGQSNPLFRPVLAEYQQIALRLERRKTKGITQRLAELRAMREQIRRRMGAIGDYLNWFEATQARSASGAFREYLKAAESTEERQPHRHDPISIYLDALEAEVGN